MKFIQILDYDIHSGRPPNSMQFARLIQEDEHEFEYEDSDGDYHVEWKDSYEITRPDGRRSYLAEETTDINFKLEVEVE